MTAASGARRPRRQAGAGGLLPVLGVVAAVFLALPLIGLLQRTPWGEIGTLLTEPEATAALRLSLVVAVTATVLATVLGVPLAWLLARVRFRGRALVRALVLLPMVLPPVVGGVALLFALGRRGLVGQYLDEWFGITLPFTTTGAVLAATFVALPFLVITVESGLRSLDPGFEEAARTLGASRSATFWRVTVPLLAPQLAAGAALAFARALGEFGATITFAGNVEGRTRTLPLAVYTYLQTDREAALALSVVLLFVSLLVLVLLRDRLVGGLGMIDLAGRVTRGGFTAELELRVEPGEVVGVLGENGAGKSTLLRVLAGLTPLDEGTLRLGDRIVDDPTADVLVAPDERPTGLVLQEPTLFPHLDLRDNAAFGLRRQGMAKEAARAVAEDWLGRLGVDDQARSRPRDVSGGQAQRAAIARALARDPDVLLLDEPLAALDQDGRTLVRRLLRGEERRADRAVVLVSHDPVDALSLTDRLVVLEEGRVSQTGTPAEITRRPRSAFVARLVGLNLLEGAATAGVVSLSGGAELVTASSLPGAVLVTLAPHSIALYRARPDGSPRNTWAATVEDLEAVGDRVRVALGGPIPLVAEVTPAAVADLALVAGQEVWATVKATDIDVYPA